MENECGSLRNRIHSPGPRLAVNEKEKKSVAVQGPVNADVRKQIRLVRYQSEKISASYQVFMS